jgi:hypothetical protein
MRKRILTRDEALAGSINPMLTRYGEEVVAARWARTELAPSTTRRPMM